MTSLVEERKSHMDGMLETISRGLRRGYIFVKEDETIGAFGDTARKIMGVTLEDALSGKENMAHPAGKLNEGDIVIIADNEIGLDDELTPEDLKYINIYDKNINEGDALIAIGVYKNSKMEPVYKAMNDFVTESKIELNQKYLGFNINVVIDYKESIITISVNGQDYVMEYLEAIGHMVVIDGMTGIVKFFQTIGYGFRNEEVGTLLRGGEYVAKDEKELDREALEVIGKSCEEVFGDSEIIGAIRKLMQMENGKDIDAVYEIHKRMLYFNMVRYKQNNEMDGVYLFLQDNSMIKKRLATGNAINTELERRRKKKNLGSDKAKLISAEFKNYIGNAPAMEQVKQLAYKAAKTKFNVILTGESGTGKSKLAREIHEIYNKKAPFVEVTCNAIAPSLIESELFGYVSGAFTGAASGGRAGYFEEANGGTIFLDEIGELPMDIQIKLLYVLQNKRIFRVGSTKPIDVDVRVITATNKNLEEEVAAGRFRQDLYYRINVFPIQIPPLRERKRDLYVLINSILNDICNRYDIEPKQFSEEALEVMMGYDWPGNVRELENIIERAITVCDGHVVYSEHLMIAHNIKTAKSLKEKLEIEERRIIEDTLFKNNDDKKKTMEELGISKSVFYDKLKKMGR